MSIHVEERREGYRSFMWKELKATILMVRNLPNTFTDFRILNCITLRSVPAFKDF